MSDCTAIYPAKTIECLRDAGHDGDHAGQDDAGFQVYWSKPNAAYVPASALDAANEALRAANEETKRLRAFIQSRTPDHHVGSTDPRACHPTCKRDEDGECVDHWPELTENECDAAPGFAADEECDRCAALAALAPKES